jgi:hypothetical protein
MVLPGRALLIFSGYLVTSCRYTYSVRLVRLICRSHVLLGRALLILSAYLVQSCRYTYSVRLVRLLCRSHVSLGRALLILSAYLITQCGYTYSVRLVQLLCRSHGVARSGPTHTLWLSDYTVWIHLLSKAGAAALPIPWCCCSLAMGRLNQLPG